MQKQTDPSGAGWAVHRPISSATRLIIPYTAAKCCSGSLGLEGESKKLPEELKALGVDEYQWDVYVKKLEEEVQPTAPSGCAQCSYWTCAITGLFCCLWYTEGKHQGMIRKWLEEFNDNVLKNHNFYAKFQTNEIHTKDYHETISWLAIAMTAEEAMILREEPVLWMPKCCSTQIVPGCCPKICCWCGPRRYV